MKLISISIAYFRSFTSEQTFHFPEGPGLLFLTGENKAEPRLGANGAGKSTLWDALFWVLYGKTLRGLSGGDVVNWKDEGKSRVALTYEVDDVMYQVVRSRNPIACRLSEAGGDWVDLVDDETNPVRAHLRLNPTAATHSVFMAQQQPMFLDLKASDKAALVSEALDLDSWLTLSEAARAKAKDMDLKTATLQTKLANVVAQLEVLESYHWDTDEARWKADQRSKIATLEKEVQAHVAKIRAIGTPKAAPVNAASDKSKKLREELEQAKKDLLDVCLVPIPQLLADIKRLKRTIEERKSQPDICPTCKQSSPKSKLPPVLHKQQEEELATLLKECDDLMKVQADTEDLIKDLQEELTQAQAKQKAAEWAIRDHHRNLDELERKIDMAAELADMLRKETNPFTTRRIQDEAKIKVLREQHDDLVNEVALSQFATRGNEFWITGFKEIRMRLISEALNQLETEVNSCLMELGLDGWELRFDVERETKSGSKQIGFHVNVISPTNTKPVPWEAWSGGESQRLRIAATMGMSNLIRNSTGTGLNLEVWDEPTQHLSSQGVEDLLGSLRNRADSEQRQIWVVDHRSLGYSDFDGTVTITKGVEGSVIGSTTC